MADLDALLEQAKEAATIGPNDVLVLSFDGHLSRAEFASITEHFKDGPLAGRVLLIAGASKVLVARDAIGGQSNG